MVSGFGSAVKAARDIIPVEVMLTMVETRNDTINYLFVNGAGDAIQAKKIQDATVQHGYKVISMVSIESGRNNNEQIVVLMARIP